MSTTRGTTKLEPDGYEVADDDPLRAEHELVSHYLKQGRAQYDKKLMHSPFPSDPPRYWFQFSGVDTETEQAILKTSREEQARVFSACLPRLVWIHERHNEWNQWWKKDPVSADTPESDDLRKDFRHLNRLETLLLRRKLPLSRDAVLTLAAFYGKEGTGSYELTQAVVRAIDYFVSRNGLDWKLRQSIGRFNERIGGGNGNKTLCKILTAADEPSAAYFSLRPGEVWTDQALDNLQNLPEEEQQAWSKLLVHCESASAGRPAAKWLKTAGERLEAVGRDGFKDRVLTWFPLAELPYARTSAQGGQVQKLDDDILKGLAWYCGLVDDPELARALTSLARTAYKNWKPSERVGNACVIALGSMSNTEAIGQLALLRIKVKIIPAQKAIDKALRAAAERLGIPRDELEEMVVPSYGLEDVGRRTATLGEFTARLTITGTGITKLDWLKPDGKVQKSVPAAVKNDFPDELKQLKAAAKDIQKMLPAQRDRIDSLFRQDKSWPVDIWRERYLDHPLVGTLARRLIWRFERGKNRVAAIFSGDGFVDHRDKAVDWPDDETTVRLWHPIDEDKMETVLAWRAWLMEHEVQQPFKQAHREIYVLTDAERNTVIYSNRFAAHVLKQHQFNALCGARNWKNRLRLMVGEEYPPAHVDLPAWNLRAEFWVEGIGEDITDAFTYLYLATDQVRFYHRDAAINSAHAGGGGYSSTGTDRDENNPLDLESIPPLVFSEVMRDVDLFVGVASVGNDPLWADGGPEGRYRDYWQSFSFGELGATAGTRKAVLEKLIPRLKIADRCSFSDRFMIVQGEIRTYKIHLGSGNILMEPNDEYLCIVPKSSIGAGSGGGVFLPFEGDRTMSIILSKALMLADDKKIKDRTIVSQITQR